MGRNTDIKTIERQIRSSLIYHHWATRNIGIGCFFCSSQENLQVHHVVELYHIILGYWKLFGDAENVVKYVTEIHEQDEVQCLTLCEKCHKKHHPGRSFPKDIRIRNDDFCVVSRELPASILHSSTQTEGLSLIGCQVLSGIGWYILNGHMDSRILTSPRNEMAKHLCKAPGTSFNQSLERCLPVLERYQVIIGWTEREGNVEVHMDPAYLEKLYLDPWFFDMKDICTSKSVTFALRRYLCCRSHKRFRIGIERLAERLYIKTTKPKFFSETIIRATKEISWATVSFKKGLFTFTIRQRGAVPIHTLRNKLFDALNQGS